MSLKHIDLTTALRPAYLPDEVLLFVQDNVGLYEGKFKLPNQQNGQVYLTSHRICYVDKDEPRRNSAALDLKDIDRYEFSARFLKSSPKVTLIPKPSKRSSAQTRVSGAASSSSLGRSSPKPASPLPPPVDQPPVTTATWVCTICSFSNPVPSNFDPQTASAHTPLPPCLACGIKPTLSHILKASISNASNRPQAAVSNLGAPVPVRYQAQTRPGAGEVPNSSGLRDANGVSGPERQDVGATFECPRCTFSNHPSLLSCEICGAPLISQDLPATFRAPTRTESPGPVLTGSPTLDGSDHIKISFRDGGEKIFYERLKGAITQRKWLLRGAPPIPKSNKSGDEALYGSSSSRSGGSGNVKAAGIAALEQRGLDMRKNNEVMIGTAFEDLEALMSSAREIVSLAERFARQGNGSGGHLSPEASTILAESANQLGLVTTKDIVGGGGRSETLYLSELSRNLADFLTDDARGVLRKAGGIVSLVDLWAMFNRSRGGVELVSPMDFEKAARMWEKLHLPVRLRTFKSGVMVVQSHDRTDETTIKAVLAWLDDLHEFPPEKDVAWDWHQFGQGVTAQDAAEKFGWSIGVAEEELEMAEEKGVLCREEGIEGLKFWVNHIDTGDTPPPGPEMAPMVEELKKLGFI